MHVAGKKESIVLNNPITRPIWKQKKSRLTKNQNILIPSKYNVCIKGWTFLGIKQQDGWEWEQCCQVFFGISSHDLIMLNISWPQVSQHWQWEPEKTKTLWKYYKESKTKFFYPPSTWLQKMCCFKIFSEQQDFFSVMKKINLGYILLFFACNLHMRKDGGEGGWRGDCLLGHRIRGLSIAQLGLAG